MTVPIRTSRRPIGGAWRGGEWIGREGLLGRPAPSRRPRSRTAESSARRVWYTPMSSTFLKTHNALLERQQVIFGVRDSDSNRQCAPIGLRGFQAIKLGTRAIGLNLRQVNHLRCSSCATNEIDRAIDNAAQFGSSDFDRAPDPRIVNGIPKYVLGIPYLDGSRRLHAHPMQPPCIQLHPACIRADASGWCYAPVA